MFELYLYSKCYNLTVFWMSVALKTAKWAWMFKKQKKTPRYLGLFWIISESSFATPQYIGHRGVLTHKVLKSLDSPVHRTPGSFDSLVLRTILDHQQINYCESPVHRTPGSFDSPVHRTPGSLDSPVHRTPGSHFKMLITQPIGKKIETALGHV